MDCDGLGWTLLTFPHTRSSIHNGVRRPSRFLPSLPPLFIHLADPRMTPSSVRSVSFVPREEECNLCRGEAEGAMSSSPVGNALRTRRPTSLPPPKKASKLILREAARSASAPAAAAAVAEGAATYSSRSAAVWLFLRSGGGGGGGATAALETAAARARRSHRRRRRRPPSGNDTRHTLREKKNYGKKLPRSHHAARGTVEEGRLLEVSVHYSQSCCFTLRCATTTPRPSRVFGLRQNRGNISHRIALLLWGPPWLAACSSAGSGA